MVYPFELVALLELLAFVREMLGRLCCGGLLLCTAFHRARHSIVRSQMIVAPGEWSVKDL